VGPCLQLLRRERHFTSKCVIEDFVKWRKLLLSKCFYRQSWFNIYDRIQPLLFAADDWVTVTDPEIKMATKSG
jgi:hypothetical protein